MSGGRRLLCAWKMQPAQGHLTALQSRVEGESAARATQGTFQK